MMDLRETRFNEMFDYAYSWTVINHMEKSRAYLKQLDTCLKRDCRTGNIFDMYPEVIPVYFVATMGLSHDKIFTDIMKGSFLFENRSRNMDISKERGFYETDDISIISMEPASESRYTSTSAYPYVENLIKLVISCSKIAIYHHDDELLKVLQKEPDKIVNLVTESEQILPGEYLFLKRLKMMILSMISVSNPSTNNYSLE